MRDKVSYQQGKNGIAFVFSCPGRYEKDAGCVCAGVTGKNLEILLDYCNHEMPNVFTSKDRADYTITNASDAIHYKAETQNSESDDAEILESNNLNRLEKELSEHSLIICMGKKASLAVSHISIFATVIQAEHLSLSHLNRKYTKNTGCMNTMDRVEKVAEKIIERIQSDDRWGRLR